MHLDKQGKHFVVSRRSSFDASWYKEWFPETKHEIAFEHYNKLVSRLNKNPKTSQFDKVKIEFLHLDLIKKHSLD